MPRSVSNPIPLTERDLSALICSLSSLIIHTEHDLSKAREQLSQQLTSIKCTTLASSKCSWSPQLLTVVPSTKGWRHQFGGRSWLFRLQLRGKLTVGPHLLVLLFCAIPLFNSPSLAYAIPSLHSCGKYLTLNFWLYNIYISENPNWMVYKSSLAFYSVFFFLFFFFFCLNNNGLSLLLLAACS
jgi:hypothetical protein